MITVSPSLTTTVSLVAQEQVHRGPQGPEFGKAAPVGLFVIIGLLVVILALGYFFNRRMRTMHQRRDFAEAHGLDPFDIDTIDRRMAQADATGEDGTGGTAGATDDDGVGRDAEPEDAGGDQR
ncbi:hypothetical protein PQI66_00115 [Corynebacterium sp. USCH3]|uniref:hypothetical protein n=1 Tax=Corynebacterium sp. USCH3 TaxID=3024840 RepID=UPI0030B12975